VARGAKLEEYRNAYYELTGKASDNARQLAFAGIAVIWVFKSNAAGPGIPLIPKELIWAGLCFCFALGADLLHYAYSGAAWGIWARKQERKGLGQEDRVLAPKWINWITLVFFWGKIIAVAAGYGFVTRFVAKLL